MTSGLEPPRRFHGYSQLSKPVPYQLGLRHHLFIIVNNIALIVYNSIHYLSLDRESNPIRILLHIPSKSFKTTISYLVNLKIPTAFPFSHKRLVLLAGFEPTLFGP